MNTYGLYGEQGVRRAPYPVLRDAAERVARAIALMTAADPLRVEEVTESLESAVMHLRPLKAGEAGAMDGPETLAQVEDFRARVRRLAALLRHAEAFYRSWAALAAVTADERRGTAISVEA